MALQQCKILDLGLVDYARADRFQREILANRYYGETVDTLLVFELSPVFTVGRHGTYEHIVYDVDDEEDLERVDVYDVDRGGEAIFHGPGQLIAYPIFDLHHYKKDLKYYLTCLEDVTCHFLKKYNVQGERHISERGIWVDDKKIVSVGIGMRHWITYHGLAINIDMDLSYFDMIVPHGFPHSEMGQLRDLVIEPIKMASAKQELMNSFTEVFHFEIAGTEKISALA